MRFSGLVCLALFWTVATVWAGEGVIKGTVRDSETGQAVPHAWVSVQIYPVSGNVLTAGGDARPGPAMETSELGAFELKAEIGPGYALRVYGDGYVTPEVPMVRLSEEAPVRVLDVRVSRMAAIECRIVDAETKEPVRGVTVSAGRFHYSRGQASIMGLSSVTTGADGVFKAERLRPDGYGLEISSVKEEISAGREPDYEDETKRASGIWRTFWPPLGGVAAGFELRAGERLNLGDIAVRRQPLYRIRGKLLVLGCEAGDLVQLAVNQQYGGLNAPRANQTLPCGASFTLKNLSPGIYQMSAHVRGRALGERTYAFSEVSVVDRDVEVELEPRLPLRVTVRAHLPDAAVLEKPIRITWRPSRGLAFWDEQPVQLDAQLRAVIDWLDRGEATIGWRDLPEGFYVREATYNGAKVDLSHWRVNAYALTHSLEVWFSDQGATLSGLVTRQDEAIPEAVLAVISWPIVAGEFPTSRRAQADAEGRFTVKSLPPGHYRVVACAPDRAARLERPGVLAALAAGAEDLSLAEGGTAQVRMVPSEP